MKKLIIKRIIVITDISYISGITRVCAVPDVRMNGRNDFRVKTDDCELYITIFIF